MVWKRNGIFVYRRFVVCVWGESLLHTARDLATLKQDVKKPAILYMTSGAGNLVQQKNNCLAMVYVPKTDLREYAATGYPMRDTDW